MSTELHEAAHAATALWFRRPVAYVWRSSGHSWPGETIGHCRAPVGERIDITQVPIALAGYWADGEEGWPPDFEQAKQEELEALGLVLELLGLDEEQYNRVVALCAEVFGNPDFLRLRDAIARALARAPRLEDGDIEALCIAYFIPLPEKEAAPC